MKAALVVALLLTGSLLTWIILQVFRICRHSRDLNQLVERIDHDRANVLCEFVETRANIFDYRGENLWEAIGGVPGLFAIRREAGILFMIAVRIAHEYPQESRAPVVEGIFTKCLYLWPLLLATLLEELLHRRIPSLPRMQAYALAKLYCDIFDTIEAIRCLPLEYAEGAV